MDEAFFLVGRMSATRAAVDELTAHAAELADRRARLLDMARDLTAAIRAARRRARRLRMELP